MRIGLCTTDFAHPMPAMELFEKISFMGFSTVQLAFCSVQECGFDASSHIEIPGTVPLDAISAIRSAAEEAELAISAVNGTWNMAHADPAIRAEGLRRFPGFCEAVCAIGAPVVSLCSGSRSPEGLWRHHPDTQTSEAWADMAQSMREATHIAEEYGLVLAIETEASNVIDTPEKARKIMDEIGSPNLKMILDCANLFHHGQASPAAMRPTIDRAIAQFGKDIVLAHGKDIRPSDGIDFCGTGFGIVDFPYVVQRLDALGYAGDMVLHGIYSEKDMPGCLQYMQSAIAEARKEKAK